MDLELKESQQMLVGAAHRFLERSYPLERMRQVFLVDGAFDPALWTNICELGWNAAPFPESIGGYEGGLVDGMLLLMEMGESVCATPYPHSTIAAGMALAAVQSSVASQIAQSRAVVIPVPSNLLREVSLSGNRLTGTTWPVPWAEQATHFLVQAANRAYLIEAKASGVKRVPLASSRGEPLSEVRLDNAAGEEIGTGSTIFADVRSYGAFACAAFLQGMSERALSLCIAYAKEREQFGRPIGSFQAIQHKAADMRIIADVGHALVLRAGAEQDRARFALSAARAKAWTADGARKISRDAMQIFGGISFCGEHPVQLIYQLVMTIANHYGAAHDHRATLAADLLGARHGL